MELTVMDKRVFDRPILVQSVLLEDQSSNSHPVLSGVPQGAVLAPLLFLIYINDITKSITSTIRLYADDILIIIHTESDATSLQKIRPSHSTKLG